MTKQDVKFIAICGMFACIALSILAYFGYQSKIVETEQIRVQEAAATERTEERSQFWQKLIPWGSDESEASK